MNPFAELLQSDEFSELDRQFAERTRGRPHQPQPERRARLF
jgi:hypothetical protein